MAGDGAAGVVGAVARFGGERPGRFVAGAGVYGAEEGGVESGVGGWWMYVWVRRGGWDLLDFYIVGGEEVAVLLELEEGEVAVEGRWGVSLC